ncbi:hypothetical protein MUN84_08200 [Hymenobacter sp. 5516J-16]|uniref:hypothetical protein n=1 Tax=Hymenobacter sp. 5516J-16 TaxID=2932253 RepID=UPI001FD12210|nr:hypothetical protein [Hymenobacter sp. 5516J-16]UOQ78521.1 hypothetical protein MUN84_08200 [Hymenobacter sp. 5516J-16]
MMEQYDWQNHGLRPENRVMIHNQYLHQLVGAELWGCCSGYSCYSGLLCNPHSGVTRTCIGSCCYKRWPCPLIRCSNYKPASTCSYSCMDFW